MQCLDGHISTYLNKDTRDLFMLCIVPMCQLHHVVFYYCCSFILLLFDNYTSFVLLLSSLDSFALFIVHCSLEKYSILILDCITVIWIPLYVFCLTFVFIGFFCSFHCSLFMRKIFNSDPGLYYSYFDPVVLEVPVTITIYASQ